MLTTIDKALQDFIISGFALAAALGFDFSSWQNVVVVVGGALGKALITWLVPNKKPA